MSRSNMQCRALKIRVLLAFLVSTLAVIANTTASADPPTFRISQVFSNLDGSLQYVELTETAGLNGQHRFAGLILTVTSYGVEKRYVFPRDLPTEQTAHRSIVVAASDYGHLPIGSVLGNFNCCYEPTFATLPLRFLPTAGATLDFAGVDQLTYASLPTDGARARFRDGTVQLAAVTGTRCYMGAGCGPTFPIAASYIFAIEYHETARDHYFLTALADEIDALDAGRFSGWQRTGQSVYIGGGFHTHPGLDHRHTMSTAIRDGMVHRGYVSEGYGPMGVAMCVP